LQVNQNYMSLKIIVAIIISLLMGSFALATAASAQTTDTQDSGHTTEWHGGWQGDKGGKPGMRPGVFGTVSSVSGTTITVTSKFPHGKDQNTDSSTETVYTVDTSNATVTKDGASSSVADIVVGDMVMVEGTVNGTAVTATAVHDGMNMGDRKPGGHQDNPENPGTIIKGTGEPVIGGNITAVNGSILTVVNKSNITYTVDASSAMIEKDRATSTVASLSVGDSVIVQGVVNGTSITASSVMDQGVDQRTTSSTSDQQGSEGRHGFGGFMRSIGGFFEHLFGFF
jgi:hypothetical protein